MNVDYSKAVQAYCAGARATYVVGDTYESLWWAEQNDLPKPTQTQLSAAYAAALAAQADILHNAGLQAQLDDIDAKKVRAVTDAILNGDMTRLQTLEAHAILLRQQIIKG